MTEPVTLVLPALPQGDHVLVLPRRKQNHARYGAQAAILHALWNVDETALLKACADLDACTKPGQAPGSLWTLGKLRHSFLNVLTQTNDISLLEKHFAFLRSRLPWRNTYFRVLAQQALQHDAFGLYETLLADLPFLQREFLQTSLREACLPWHRKYWYGYSRVQKREAFRTWTMSLFVKYHAQRPTVPVGWPCLRATIQWDCMPPAERLQYWTALPDIITKMQKHEALLPLMLKSTRHVSDVEVTGTFRDQLEAFCAFVEQQVRSENPQKTHTASPVMDDAGVGVGSCSSGTEESKDSHHDSQPPVPSGPPGPSGPLVLDQAMIQGLQQAMCAYLAGSGYMDFHITEFLARRWPTAFPRNPIALIHPGWRLAVWTFSQTPDLEDQEPFPLLRLLLAHTVDLLPSQWRDIQTNNINNLDWKPLLLQLILHLEPRYRSKELKAEHIPFEDLLQETSVEQDFDQGIFDGLLALLDVFPNAAQPLATYAAAWNRPDAFQRAVTAALDHGLPRPVPPKMLFQWLSERLERFAAEDPYLGKTWRELVGDASDDPWFEALPALTSIKTLSPVVLKACNSMWRCQTWPAGVLSGMLVKYAHSRHVTLEDVIAIFGMADIVTLWSSSTRHLEFSLRTWYAAKCRQALRSQSFVVPAVDKEASYHLYDMNGEFVTLKPTESEMYMEAETTIWPMLLEELPAEVRAMLPDIQAEAEKEEARRQANSMRVYGFQGGRTGLHFMA